MKVEGRRIIRRSLEAWPLCNTMQQCTLDDSMKGSAHQRIIWFTSLSWREEFTYTDGLVEEEKTFTDRPAVGKL